MCTASEPQPCEAEYFGIPLIILLSAPEDITVSLYIAKGSKAVKEHSSYGEQLREWGGLVWGRGGSGQT